MNRKRGAPLLALALAALLSATPAQAAEAEVRRLVPVGRAVGMKLFSDGVLVVGFSQIPVEGGSVIPARQCGLKEGDVITHINADEVDSIEEVQSHLQAAGGEKMSIRALRGGKQVQFTAQAVRCSTDGTYKLGAWLRDSMAGIGTITWYDPASGTFGALGHGVNDPDTGVLMPLDGGGVIPATVTDVKKGQRGEPGELHGDFDAGADVGTLTSNTAGGVFGTLTDASMASLPAVEAARADQVEPGEAVIYSNVAGQETRAYAVTITRVLQDSRDGRDMVLKVTDPALLEATGGIVQGMVVRYNRDNTGKP